MFMQTIFNPSSIHAVVLKDELDSITSFTLYLPQAVLQSTSRSDLDEIVTANGVDA
jgi:hypothetical protein